MGTVKVSSCGTSARTFIPSGSVPIGYLLLRRAPLRFLLQNPAECKRQRGCLLTIVAAEWYRGAGAQTDSPFPGVTERIQLQDEAGRLIFEVPATVTLLTLQVTQR